MTAPFTMKSASDLLKTLMDEWEAALFHAERTGYWLDVTACDRGVEAYGAEIAKARFNPASFPATARKRCGGGQRSPHQKPNTA